jgi:hypothetical protein
MVSHFGVNAIGEIDNGRTLGEIQKVPFRGKDVKLRGKQIVL